jgi:hypothetical protein
MLISFLKSVERYEALIHTITQTPSFRFSVKDSIYLSRKKDLAASAQPCGKETAGR